MDLPVRLTEPSLKAAMRDPRYWSPAHPERAAYTDWVTRGWQSLYPREGGARGVVYVRPYTRQRDGRTEQVGAHARGAPASGGHASPLTPVSSNRRDPATGRLLMPGERGTPLEGAPGMVNRGRDMPVTRPPAPTPTWSYTPGMRSPAAEASPSGPRTVTLADRSQLQSKFARHARDFDVQGGANNTNLQLFSERLGAHVNSPTTARIVGTYHREPVIHYVDPATRLNVITRPDGTFWSSWRLNERQMWNVWYRGSL